MKRIFSRGLAAIALAIGIGGGAQAEDIDIFSGIAAASGSVPKILIIVDSRASNDATVSPYACPIPGLANGKMLDMLQCGLYLAFDAIRNQPALLGSLRVGLMHVGPNDNKYGEMMNPSRAPWDLVLMDRDGVNAFKSFLLPPTDIKSQGGAGLGDQMMEAWAFFSGNPSPHDPGLTYTSQLGGSITCQRSVIIMIGNVDNKHNNPSNRPGGAFADLARAVPTPSATQLAQINTSSIGPDIGEDVSTIDEWTRYLNQTDFGSAGDRQNIVTYAIGTYGVDGIWGAKSQQMRSAAQHGGGKYYLANTIGDFTQAVLQIFNEVAAVNSVFASSSLPVSTNSQGTYQNQVFIGMFRPDASPRWVGNLKQYQFGVDETNPADPKLFLADSRSCSPTIANCAALSSSGTGFLSPDAISIWTSKNVAVLPDRSPPGGFWANNSQGVGMSFDSPDGEVVEKGGVGQRLRLASLQTDHVASPSAPRNMYTCFSCSSGAALSAHPFATTNTNLTDAVLGITNPIYTASVSSIARVSSSGFVTLTLAAAANPVITDATTVVIAGSTGGQYNYGLSGKSPNVGGPTTVTFSLQQELPPTSLATPGAWTVTGAAAGSTSVSSLTRSTNAGLATVTASLADVTFGGSASAVAVGDTIVIANSTGYNGTGTITGVSGNTATFTMSETPSVYSGGAQVSVGSSNCKTNGAVNAHNCASAAAASTNGPGAGQANLPGLVRGTSCAGCTANSGKILMINFSGGTTELNATVPATGVKAFVHSGPYANTSTGYTIVGTGGSCSVTETHTDGTTRMYTGTANATGPRYYTLCVDLGSGFSITPVSGSNGATVSPLTTATRANSSFTRTISSLSRGASACTGTSSGATANNAIVTLNTTVPHGFVAGEVVQLSSQSPGSDELAYVGSATLITASGTTMTYAIGTKPACVDTAAGMTITHQSSADGIDKSDLIRWVRGHDNIGDEQSPGSGITVRPSVHGDVLHSRPSIINYGGSTGVVVFYGSNDGTFRAINGNQTGNIGSTPPGGELWSFIPTEFLSRLQRAYSNSPLLKLALTPVGITPTPTPKDYFFDGIAGVYHDATVTPSKAYVFLSARRGGRLIYALDVSDPQNPLFMWKKGCPNLTDNVGCSTGFESLGQTWSTVKAMTVRGSSNPVVVLGGGYDPNEDSEPPATPGAGKPLMGNSIFILDATNGSILWQAKSGGGTNKCSGTPCALLDMTYSIPSDAALLDRDFDGYVDRIYVPDMGGNIWRIDTEPTAGNTPAYWQATRIAAVGGTGSTKRKIMYPPDVILTKTFDMVLAGTGDREHPLYANASLSIVNRFYGIKDLNPGKDGGTFATVIDATSSTANAAPPALFNANGGVYDLSLGGFYYTLQNTGEKVVNAPKSVGAFTYFGTSTPTAPANLSCSNHLGTARGYQINYLTGAVSSQIFDGGGLPPSPVTGMVTVPVNGVDQTLTFVLGGIDPTRTRCVGADCKSSLGGLQPTPPITPLRKRVYWYNQKQDK